MITSNLADIQKLFKEFPDKVSKAFDTGANLGMQVFLGTFTREQLSGRKGKIGLNRISSNLANSWKVTANKEEHSVQLASSSSYAHVHAHANGFDGWIKPKSGKGGKYPKKPRFIPKRMFLYESFGKIGHEMISKGFRKHLTIELNKG